MSKLKQDYLSILFGVYTQYKLSHLTTEQIKEELSNRDPNLAYSPLSGISYRLLEVELRRRELKDNSGSKNKLGGKLNYLNFIKY